MAEEKFHNEGFFFGDCLNVEIEKIIPGLKKLHESNLDLVIYLSKKEKALMTFKQGIELQAENGQINEQKYIEYLTLFKGKNEQLLK